MTLQTKLPIIVTVSQAGQQVPEGVTAEMVGAETFSEAQLYAEAADELFDLEHRVNYFYSAPLLMPIMNVDETKTHAVHSNVPSKIKRQLVKDYYEPFHKNIIQACQDESLRFGLDLHIYKGSDEDKKTIVCLGNNGDVAGEHSMLSGHLTCPTVLIRDFMDLLAAEFSDIDGSIYLNKPCSGGYISKTYHSNKLPWIRLAIPSHMISNRFHQLLTKRIEQLYNRIHAAITFLFKVQGWLDDDQLQ